MSRCCRALLLALLALPAPALAQTSGPIEPGRMSAVVQTLTADSFEGRAPGSDGAARTLAFLVRRLRALGYEPAGEEGGWTQTVRLIRTRIAPGGNVAVGGAAGTLALRPGTDLGLAASGAADRVAIGQAPILFLGRDLTETTATPDLAGAVLLLTEQGGLGDAGRWQARLAEAGRRGVAAVLFIRSPGALRDDGTFPAARDGDHFALMDGAAQPPLHGWISRDAAERLLARSRLKLDRLERSAARRGFKPASLTGQTFTADLAVSRARVDSYNVLARLTGVSTPGEAVLFATHWDGPGLVPPDPDGDKVAGGAVGNALGVAGMLELAKALAEGRRPARTLLLALWTGGERGWLGAEAYARAPLHPLEKTAAVLTFDGLQPVGPAKDVVLAGQGLTTLDRDVAGAAAVQGRRITVGRDAELWRESSHYPLARRGVPAVLLSVRAGGVDLTYADRETSQRWLDFYLANCRNRPCDRWQREWNLRGAAQDVALLGYVGISLAASDRWPEWRPGSEFANVRQASAAARGN